MNTPPRLRSLAWRAALTASLAALLVAHASAAPLTEYTGYTRPANVDMAESKPIKKAAVFASLADRKMGKEVGVTVYYMVLDRENGVAGDTWGTGIKNFDKRFLASRDCPNARLDTKAKYRYLYQVINDSGLDGALHQASI